MSQSSRFTVGVGKRISLWDCAGKTRFHENSSRQHFDWTKQKLAAYLVKETEVVQHSVTAQQELATHGVLYCALVSISTSAFFLKCKFPTAAQCICFLHIYIINDNDGTDNFHRQIMFILDLILGGIESKLYRFKFCCRFGCPFEPREGERECKKHTHF